MESEPEPGAQWQYGKLATLSYQLDKPIGSSFGDVEFYRDLLSGVTGEVLEPAVGTGRILIPLLEQRTTGWLRYELWREGELVRTELQLFTLQWYGLGEFSAMLRDAGFPQVSVHADYHAGQYPADGSRVWTFEATRG